MTNNLVKLLVILACSSTPALTKASHTLDNRHQADRAGKHSRHHHRAIHHRTHRVLPTDNLSCVANTAYHEARNSDANLQAVANVVKNRLLAGWGDSYCNVVRTGAFAYSGSEFHNERYAKALEVAEKVLLDELPDNTGGAVFFHSQRLRHLPRWAKPDNRTASIDGNVFYRDDS
ncbi:MAG: cell wall hydrolase [Methylococcaceae bacterium]|nr:cell wall hydrolase [Methylococcaceae bacterium]